MKLARTLLLAAAFFPCSTAFAQDWPAKPIRIVVHYTPGGSSDIIARAISQPLSDALKQTVVVENKPGANGNTGTDLVAKSPADGYTLLLCDVGALSITSSVYSKLPFDPSKDLHGVGMLANGMLATLPFVQSGRLRVVGVSRATRVPMLPEVPTIAEQGVKGFESGTWQGVLVPAGTPPGVVARLATELTRIIRSPDVRSRLTAQGAEVYTMSPPEFTQFFEKERSKWATVVTQSGVKLD